MQPENWTTVLRIMSKLSGKGGSVRSQTFVGGMDDQNTPY